MRNKIILLFIVLYSWLESLLVPEKDAEEKIRLLKFDNLTSEEFDYYWKACRQHRLEKIQYLYSTTATLEKWTFYNQPSGFRLRNENKSEKLYPNYDGNIWLRSCEEEIITPQNGKIKGCIPHWLNGSLIRNGPGLLKVGNEEFQHLFDCSALLHRFGIVNGKVTYQCRFLQSETYKTNWSAKRIIMTEFGTKAVEDPCRSIFKRISSIFSTDVLDNSMVSVYPFGDELYAFGEIPIIHQIDQDTLQTEGKVDIRDHISIVHHTAHPHVTPNGTVYNLGMSVSATGPYHNILEFPKNKEGSSKAMFKNAKIIASIRARWPLNPSYMHTFGITDNYYIIIEQPLCISSPAMIGAKFNDDPILSTFRWYQEEYTQISVVSRSTGKKHRTFFADPFFYVHIINQYESDHHIVLDICIYKDPSILDGMYIEAIKSAQRNPDYAKMLRGRPVRFVLPLNPRPMVAANKNIVDLENTKAAAHYMSDGNILVQPEKLIDIGCEMPKINYDNYVGKPYKFFYATGIDIDSEILGNLIKVDTDLKSFKTWGEKNCYPSEAVFVPNPEAKDEDDGVLLSALVWGGGNTNKVGLLVLDAKTFTELGRAEFRTPGPVPTSFHGWYLPKK